MRDGVILLADRYAPRDGGGGLPVALMRSPYGRRGFIAAMARPLAERGYQVAMQNGLTSVTGAEEPGRVTVSLWPTAHRFKRGHRIRVQVSSGAFPRNARNPGSGEPHASATRLLAADQAVYHDAERPSAIILPVRTAS